MNILKFLALAMPTLVLANVPVEKAPFESYKPIEATNSTTTFPVKNSYAYSPATVYYNGMYHQFYCSVGSESDAYFYHPDRYQFKESWDHIRYRYSRDGVNWSPTKIVITQAPKSSSKQNFPDVNTPENCACDPAVIRGDDGYWYLFYQGAQESYGGTLYVARSQDIQGPYAKFTGTRSNPAWDRWTDSPTPLLYQMTKEGVSADSIYGLGQYSVVKKDGKYHFWFIENNNIDYKYTSRDSNGTQHTNNYVYYKHVAVDNILDLLLLDERNNIQNSSVYDVQTIRRNGKQDPTYFGGSDTKFLATDFGEVRWSPDAGKFYMWRPEIAHATKIPVSVYESYDGVHWDGWADSNEITRPYQILMSDSDSLKGNSLKGNYIHNIGVSGDENGHIHNGQYLVSFSGPEGSLEYDEEAMCSHGFCDNGKVSVQRGIWSMWEYAHNITWDSRLVAFKDYHDFSVSPSTHKGMKFFAGDFDGDGIDELGAFEPSTNKWYLKNSSISTKKSELYWNWSNTRLKYNAATDKIIIGDYDGDGITDFGIVSCPQNASSCNWNIRSSLNGGQWGTWAVPLNWSWLYMSKDHRIVSGDYDGDGVTDLVIYAPNTSSWYLISGRSGSMMTTNSIIKSESSRITSRNLFGYAQFDKPKASAKPVVGDFDGDGIDDIAVVDMNTARWYILSSQSGDTMKVKYDSSKTATYWDFAINGKSVNISGKEILSGDYDGDGISDLGYINVATGDITMFFSKFDKVKVRNKVKNFKLIETRPPNSNGVRTWPTYHKVIEGDFDGDFATEICLIDTVKYRYAFYEFNGSTFVQKKTSSKYYTPNYSGGSGHVLLPKAAPKAVGKIDDVEIASSNIFTNVSGHSLTVDGVVDGVNVTVLNINGKKVANKISFGAALNFDLPAQGKYIVRAGAQSKIISVK